MVKIKDSNKQKESKRNKKNYRMRKRNIIANKKKLGQLHTFENLYTY